MSIAADIAVLDAAMAKLADDIAAGNASAVPMDCDAVVSAANQLYTDQHSAPPMGTANITATESALVIDPGQSVTLTYTITGATSAWLGGDMMPGANRALIADGSQHVYTYTPSRSGPFPICAQDAAGGVVVQPISVIVRETGPALDPGTVPTKTTVKSGDLADPATWGGALPGVNETALIAAGHSCTVSGRGWECGRLLIDGTLTPTPGTVIYVGDLHVRPTGSLVMLADPAQGAAGKILVLFCNRPKHSLDAADFWRAAIIEGTLKMRGLTSTSSVGLAVAPLAGDTQLHLASPVSGWLVGQKVWLPDSRQIDPKSAGYSPHGEIVVVRGVSTDGLTVYLLNPCLYAHPPDQVDGGYKPHAVHLICTVGFVTCDPTNTATRAHIQFTGKATIDCEDAIFHGFGRTLLSPAVSTPSRHNVHLLNLVGPTGGVSGHPTVQGRLANCRFIEPFPVVPTPQVRWGLALTNSHYIDLTGSVSFNWAGAAIAGAVTGNESFNIFDRCFVSKTIGSGNRGEMGTGGDGFWFRGPNNYVRNCVATQIQERYGVNPGNLFSECYGFVLNMLSSGSVRFPNFQGADTSIAGQYTSKLPMSIPPLEWRNNTTYCAPDGFTYWWIGMANGTNPIPNMPPSFIDQDVWSVWRWGCFAYQSNNLTITGDMRGSIANPTGQGILFSDYPTQNLTLDGMDIQGFNVGIYPCVNTGGGWQRFKDCHLRNVTNIQIESMWTSASSASGITAPRLIYIDNCTYGAPLPGHALLNIQMFYNTGGNRDIVKLDQTFVTAYNGTAENFQVYFTQQAGNFIVPQTTFNANGSVHLQACPVAGLTNTQALAQQNCCIAGQIAPVNAATRAGITGLVA